MDNNIFKKVYCIIFTVFFCAAIFIAPTQKVFASDLSYPPEVPYIFDVNDVVRQLVQNNEGYDSVTPAAGLATSFLGTQYKNEPIVLIRGETAEIQFNDIFTATELTCTLSFSSVYHVGLAFGDSGWNNSPSSYGSASFFTSTAAPSQTKLRDSDIVLPASKWAPNFDSIRGGGTFSDFMTQNGLLGEMYSYYGSSNICYSADFFNMSETFLSIAVADNAPGWDGTVYMWLRYNCPSDSYSFRSIAYSNKSSGESRVFYFRIPLQLEKASSGSVGDVINGVIDDVIGDAFDGLSEPIRYAIAAAGVIAFLALVLWFFERIGRIFKKTKKSMKRGLKK